MVIEQTRQSVSFSAHFSAHNKQKSLSRKIGYTLQSVGIRRVQDLNLRAGMNRVGGFRVRCITTLPTLHNSYFR